jgi:DNA mismatch repair protein MutL
METPLEEVDVNVHPAKTEVRFRRASAVADAVREAVKAALASAGYVREERDTSSNTSDQVQAASAAMSTLGASAPHGPTEESIDNRHGYAHVTEHQQSRIDFASLMASVGEAVGEPEPQELSENGTQDPVSESYVSATVSTQPTPKNTTLPPLDSAEKFTRAVTPESLSTNIRPLGQLEESFIIATDDEGLLLIDQHVAHERILFDKYRLLESERRSESQQLLVPETFDLTPAQAAVFDGLAPELENYGFELMRLSGRTVAIKATPADLPAGEARNMLSELLDTVDAEKKGSARETLRDEIAASLACHAAIKVNMPLAPEKMRWLIDRLLQTSSPTTCPHGRPVILRLKTRDILKGFHRI